MKKNINYLLSWDGIMALYMIIIFYQLYQRDILQMEINNELLALITILFACILPFEKMLCLIGFLIPLSFGGLRMTFIFASISVIILLKNKLGKTFLLTIILILLLEILHYPFYSFNLTFLEALPEVVMLISTIFVLGYFLVKDNQNINVTLFVSYYGISLLFVSVVMLLKNIEVFSVDALLLGAARLGSDEVAMLTKAGVSADTFKMYIAANSNTLAYFNIVAITSLFTIRKRVPISVLWILFPLLFLIGMMALSRTWFVVLILFIFIILFKNAKKGTVLLSFLIVMLIISLLISIYIPTVFDALVGRFSEGDVKGGNGRIDLFWEYNDYLFKNLDALIIGTGACYYKQVCQLSNSCHNSIQQVIVSYGMLGSLLLFYPFYNNTKKYVKHNVLSEPALPFWAAFVFLQTLQVLEPTYLMLPLIPAIILLKNNQKNNEVFSYNNRYRR